MNNILFFIIIGLVLIAWLFSSVDALISADGDGAVWEYMVIGASKVIVGIAIGIIIILIPTLFLGNYLKPQPEDVMPAFYYDGTYAGLVNDMDDDTLQTLVGECTRTISQTGQLSAYYDRALLYFRTNNYDLARDDLQYCYEHESNWKYAYDLGVVCGYMLDYSDSINFFETALSLDVPLSERGVVKNSLAMIESYFDGWIFSLIK